MFDLVIIKENCEVNQKPYFKSHLPQNVIHEDAQCIINASKGRLYENKPAKPSVSTSTTKMNPEGSKGIPKVDAGAMEAEQGVTRNELIALAKAADVKYVGVSTDSLKEQLIK